MSNLLRTKTTYAFLLYIPHLGTVGTFLCELWNAIHRRKYLALLMFSCCESKVSVDTNVKLMLLGLHINPSISTADMSHSFYRLQQRTLSSCLVLGRLWIPVQRDAKACTLNMFMFIYLLTKLNLGPCTGYPDWRFSLYSSVPPLKYCYCN
jgi:hypothetical protein